LEHLETFSRGLPPLTKKGCSHAAIPERNFKFDIKTPKATDSFGTQKFFPY
jgi:hypothetical protein